VLGKRGKKNEGGREGLNVAILSATLTYDRLKSREPVFVVR